MSIKTFCYQRISSFKLFPCTFEETIKRGFDILFSLFILVLFSPLFILIGLGIYFTSKGPIIYGHTRVGLHGRLFKCYKFRTMYLDAECKLEALLKNDNKLQEEWKNHFKLKNDPRVTKIGGFLRKTSLDELPQFWNVILGHLSVVGPRPVSPEEIKLYYKGKASKILSIRPGITGLWQISGRSSLHYHKRVVLDVYYTDTHHFWMDLKLIIKTVPSILFRKGAF